MQTTSIDPTIDSRRALAAQINSQPAERDDLEARYGQVWNPSELAAGFEVLGFMTPLVVVKRKTDQQLGSLLFQHQPRYYFAYQEDAEQPASAVNISFSPDGLAHCLWTEAIPLGELGRLDIQRASTVEFNAVTQLWEVRLASDPEAVAFAHASRETCLQWEKQFFDALL